MPYKVKGQKKATSPTGRPSRKKSTAARAVKGGKRPAPRKAAPKKAPARGKTLYQRKLERLIKTGRSK